MLSRHLTAFNTQINFEPEAEQPVPNVASGDGHDADASIATPPAADRRDGDLTDSRSGLPAVQLESCLQRTVSQTFENLTEDAESGPPAQRTLEASPSRLESTSMPLLSPLAQPNGSIVGTRLTLPADSAMNFL